MRLILAMLRIVRRRILVVVVDVHGSDGARLRSIGI